VILFFMGFSLIGEAQSSSDFKEFLAEFAIDMQREANSSGENTLAEMGIIAKPSFAYSKTTNTLIYKLKVSSEDIYEKMDVDGGCDGGLNGFLEEMNNQGQLKWFAEQIKEYGTSFAFVVQYREKVKQSVMSSSQIYKKAMLMLK